MAANNNNKSLIVDYSKHRDARVDRQSVSSLRSSSLHVRRTCSSHRRRPIRRRVSANDLEAALAQVDRLLRQPMMHWAQDVGGVVTSVKIGGRAALARTPLSLTPSAGGSSSTGKTGKTGTGSGSRHGSSHVGEQQLSKKIHLVPSPLNVLNTSLNSQKPTFFGLRSCHHMDETDDEEEEEDDDGSSVFEDSQSVLSDASSSVATFAADDDDDELLSASCATFGTEATTPLDQSTDTTSSSKQDESLRVSFRLKRRDGSDHQRHGQRQDRKSHDRLVDSLTLILAQAQEDPKAPTTTMRSNSSKRIFSSSMHAGGSRKGQTDSLHASNGGSTHSTRSLGQRTSMPMVLSPRDARSLRRSFHPPQPRSKSFSTATATTAINTTAPISRRTLSLKEASVQQQSARHLLRQMSFSKASFKCSLDSTNHLSKKKILPLRSSSSSSSKANSNHNNSSSNSILTTTSSHGGPTSPTSSNMRRSRSFSTQQQQQRTTTSSSIPSNNSMKNPELLFAASRTTTTPLARIRREASIRSTKNLLSEPARRTNRRRGGMSNL